jgi:excisionase family DNA binding protein
MIGKKEEIVMSSSVEQLSLTPSDEERQALRLIEETLEHHERVLKLVGTQGEQITLPDIVAQTLQNIVSRLLQGQTITLVAQGKELSTQEAAEMLNVSRPFLIKLLDEGTIPFVKVGTHRRIRLGDLVAYMRKRDAERRQGLRKLTQMSEDLGLYDE